MIDNCSQCGFDDIVIFQKCEIKCCENYSHEWVLAADAAKPLRAAK